MTNSINGTDGAQELLIKLVEQNPEDWTTRKNVAQVMYDAGFYREASKMIWSAPEIPAIGNEVIFAARIVAKGQPTRAMRLFNTLISNNISQPEENLEMAKLLVKAGMVYQAIRFYGAATALDSRLADEAFELSLVAVDSKGDSWREFVSSEDFSWEGPVVKASKPVEADAYAELLSGATMPVPMKAPVREKIERSNKLPNWEVEKTKTSFIAKEPLKPTAEVKIEPTVDAKVLELENKPVFEVESKLELVQPEPQKDPVSQTVSPSDTLEIDTLSVGIPESLLKDTLIEDVSKEKKEETFFKSYDEAHDHKGDEDVKKISDKVDPLSVPNAKAAPVTMESPVAAKAPESNVGVPKVGLPEKEIPVEAVASESADESLDDYVAGVLSDIGGDKKEEEFSGKPKGFFGGLLSSLMKKRDRQSNDTKIEGHSEKEILPNVTETVEPQADIKPQGLAKNSREVSVPVVETATAPQPNEVGQTRPSVEKPVEVAPKAVQETHVSANTVSANTVVPRPVEESHVPRELDGRTQLVALAPQNGSAYFNQLLERYNQHPEGELPKPAVLARDLANMDYLGLIGKACGKDLDAFSKLLGLHRVMINAGCSEWVNDMNLLRKGYGDAVLATVVSKYSVTECRDILNSVYSSPEPQAAAV